jgi:hypothetical protein
MLKCKNCSFKGFFLLLVDYGSTELEVLYNLQHRVKFVFEEPEPDIRNRHVKKPKDLFRKI